MSSNLTLIDISNMPELLDLVEEVETTRKAIGAGFSGSVALFMRS